MEREDTSNDAVTSLPPELWTAILVFLDARDVRLKRVSKLFNYALKDVQNLDMIKVHEIIHFFKKRSKA